MALIDQNGLREDSWTKLEDDAPASPEGDLLVSLARFKREGSSLLTREGKLGVALSSADDPAELAGAVEQLKLITVEFPKFSDGRGYSTARLLRDRYGYLGELRAVGDVLRDQLLYMKRCGFDSFELAPGRDPAEALHAFGEFSVTYQGAADEAQPLYRRHARG